MKKFFKTLSIKFKILAIPITMIAIILTLITIITSNLIKNNLTLQMKEDGIKLVTQISKQIENNEISIENSNKDIENRILAIGNYLANKSDRITSEYLMEVAEIFKVNEINVTDSDGSIIYSNLPENLGFQFTNDMQCNTVLSGKKTEFIEEIRKNKLNDNYYKYGYVAINSGGIIQVGILANEIYKLTTKLDPQNLVEDLAKSDDIVYALFIDKNLKAVAHSNKDRVGISLSDQGSKASAVDGKIFTSEFYYEVEDVFAYDVLVPVYKDGVHIGAMNVGLSMKNVKDTINQVTLVIIIIGIIALMAASLLLYLISINITKPLKNLVEVSKHISKGNFNNDIVVQNNDEIGILAMSFKEMSDNLKMTLGSIKEQAIKIEDMSSNLSANSEEMTSATNEVATAIGTVTEGSSEQANDLIEVVNNIDDLGEEINNIENKLRIVKNNSDETENKANTGKEQIDALLDSIKAVRQGFETTIDTINNLNSSVSQIGNITDVINGISEQTNLLALNAAIEAARAGEAGKGFSVVADEIKKLAEQSKGSTSQIQKLIESISGETEDVIDTSNRVKRLLEEEVTIIQNTVLSFEDIIKSISKIVPLIDDTYVSLNNTIKSKDEVSDKVTSVSSIAQETSASSEEISASSQEMLANTEEVSNFAMELNEVAAKLKDETSKFKI